MTFEEKAVLVGCEQSGVALNHQYESLCTGFAFGVGPVGLDCKIADFIARGIPLEPGATVGAGGYAFFQLGFGNPTIPFYLDAAMTTLTVLKIIDDECSPAPEPSISPVALESRVVPAPRGAGASTPGAPCWNVVLGPEHVGGTTPITITGPADVQLTAVAGGEWSVGTNLFGSHLGFGLTSPIGSVSPVLRLDFSSAIGAVRDLPVVVDNDTGVDTVTVTAYASGAPVATTEIALTAGVRGPYAEGITDVDAAVPFDRLEIACRNPARMVGIGHFIACDDPPSVADLNYDAAVDLLDFQRLDACFAGSGVALAFQCRDADFDGDADVDCDDVLWLAANVPAFEALDDDCDQNGVPDGCDVASDAAADTNGNGRPDACDVAGRGDPVAIIVSRLHPIAPNPVRDRVSLRVDVARAGPAAIEVFDVAGRRVGAVFRGMLAAGRHDLTWDAKAGAGGRVDPGIYWIRARLPGVSEQRRVVLVR